MRQVGTWVPWSTEIVVPRSGVGEDLGMFPAMTARLEIVATPIYPPSASEDEPTDG